MLVIGSRLLLLDSCSLQHRRPLLLLQQWVIAPTHHQSNSSELHFPPPAPPLQAPALRLSHTVLVVNERRALVSATDRWANATTTIPNRLDLHQLLVHRLRFCRLTQFGWFNSIHLTFFLLLILNSRVVSTFHTPTSSATFNLTSPFLQTIKPFQTQTAQHFGFRVPCFASRLSATTTTSSTPKCCSLSCCSSIYSFVQNAHASATRTPCTPANRPLGCCISCTL